MIEAAFVGPGDTTVNIRSINRDHVLREAREFCGGNIDIGVSRPNQFAVYEWSGAGGLPLNELAMKLLGDRPVSGPVVVWGVDLYGESCDVVLPLCL